MKKIAFTILALMIFAQCSWAILDEKKITLQEAIQMALDTNPQIQMLDMDVEISKNNTKVANKLNNPSLNFFQNFGKAGEGNPQQIGATYELEVLKRGKRKNLAQTEVSIAQNNRNFSQYDLILAVRKSYIDLLLKKSILNTLKHQQKLAQELYDALQKDAKKGKVPETEALQAKIALNRTIMAVNNAKSNVIFSQNRFNTVMNTSNINYDTKESGLSGNYHDLMTIEPTSDLLEFEKIKTFALERRFDLQKAREEVLAAQKNLEVVKSQLIPDVEIQSGYSYQTSSTSGTGKYMSGAYIGASLVNIPLLYQYKPEIKNAQLEIEKAELNYKDIEADALRNITDAWEKFIITKENLNFYNKELLANSKELLDASIKALADNKLDLTGFLVTKKAYFDLILEYQQALADYYTSYAELVKEMNIIEIEKEFI